MDSVRPIDDPARIQLRELRSGVGFVDGAWWPRSRDLDAELPPLLTLPALARFELTQVIYHLTDWEPAPRKLYLNGRKVRRSGFRTGEPHAVGLIDSWGRERVDLIVIAPDTDPPLAAMIMSLAAEEHGERTAGDILAEARTRLDDPAAAPLSVTPG